MFSISNQLYKITIFLLKIMGYIDLEAKSLKKTVLDTENPLSPILIKNVVFNKV